MKNLYIKDNHYSFFIEMERYKKIKQDKKRAQGKVKQI